MTALGIVDMLDSRVLRAGAAGSHSRGVTPGAAAFADVIQDAARAPAEGTDMAPSGTSTDGTSTDGAGTDLPTAPPPVPLPALPVIFPTPGSALTDGALGGHASSGEAAVPALTTSPSNVPDTGTGPADTVSSTHVDTATDAATVMAAAAAAGAVRPSAAVPDAASTRTLAGADAAGASPVRGASPLTDIAPLGTTAADDVTEVAAPHLGGIPSASVGAPAAFVAQGSPTTAVRAETLAPSESVPDASSEDAAVSVPASTATAAAAPGDAPIPTPAVGGVSAPALAAATAPTAVPAARPVLLPQITAPVVSLAQAPDGDHSITLTVSPENLGPVTVRAHISGGAIHIELHAPNDLGRDALRAILIDLRRDLAAAAPHASLTLSSSDDGPGSSTPQHPANGNGTGTAGGSNNGQQGSGTPAGREPHGTRPAPDIPPPTPEETPAVPLVSPLGGIDVFA